MKTIFLVWTFFLTVAVQNLHAQGNSCIKSIRGLCRFLLADSISKGSADGFDSVYLKRVIDFGFNRKALLRNFNIDTTVFNMETKLSMLKGTIAWLDLFLDEVGLDSITFVPFGSKIDKRVSLSPNEGNLYKRAIIVSAKLNGVNIELGKAFFDNKCRLINYTPGLLTKEAAAELRKMKPKHKI